jgi:hypothetical protein
LLYSNVVLITNINTKENIKQTTMHYSQVVLGNKELGINYSHIPTLLPYNASTLGKQLVQNVRGWPMPVLM